MRLAPFVAFVLVGYFALYGWLRASDNIKIARQMGICLKHPGDCEVGGKWVYFATVWDRPDGFVFLGNPFWITRSTQSWMVVTMWPAMKLEVGLDRRGWLPWNGIVGVTTQVLDHSSGPGDEPPMLDDEGNNRE